MERRVELETGDPRSKASLPVRKASKNFRIPLIVSALVIGAVLGASVFVGFRWYGKATEIERENPPEVIQQYLRVRFNDPMSDRVQLFVCKSPELVALESMLDELARRENGSGVDIVVGLADLVVTVNGKTASVKSDLVITYGTAAAVGREAQSWEFNLIDQDGWRLCRAHQI